MRPFFRMAVLFLSWLALAGCGAAVAPRKSTASDATNPNANLPFYVAAFSPASGTVAVLPSVVVVAFNEAELNFSTVAPLTYYNLTCGADTYAAAQVQYSAGYGVVTINLQSISGLASGTVCTFTVSSYLRDDANNYLAGLRTATYVIQ